MTKKITTISIDENVLKKAKKELPNLSIFVEDCLRAFFGLTDLNMVTIDDSRQIIRDNMLKIHLASKINETETENSRINISDCNNAWSKLWRKYRNGQEINRTDLTEADNILQVGVNELKNLMETLELTVDRVDMVKCDSWN
jgi:hypothetical protein